MPGPREQSQPAGASVTSEPDRRRDRRPSLTTWLSLIVAFAAVVATIVVSVLTNDATSKALLRAERAEAYTNYVEVHARFNEFVWSHLYHAGTDALHPETGELMSPNDDPEFWSDAIEIMGQLQAANVGARMMADAKVDELLVSLHDGEIEAFRRFKCMADLQCKDAAEKPKSNREIEAMLEAWSDQATTDKTTLIIEARKQLQ